MSERSVVVRRRIVAHRRAVELRPALPGPFVKWAGGKSKLLDELTSRAPRDFVRYFEPFVGGGALFYKLLPRAAVLSDANPELIGCYRAVRGHVEEVIARLADHAASHGEDYYYSMRERWNAGLGPVGSAERAAAFIYLNKTCYNGLWRVNSKGLFNVPMGRYAKPSILDAAGLRASSRALGRAHLEVAPFCHVLELAKAGDFVYFDPPYQPVSQTAYFTSYTSNRFDSSDQERLAGVFRLLSARGCAVMLSNSDTPLIHRLYAGFRIDRVFCARAISSRGDARDPVPEVIVTNRF
ncbi:MAG: DNA adenine methylase [Deltaproteobacteria bacterium]|nr:DNA adenine methylase [Deltaproteobacteria bacterium]